MQLWSQTSTSFVDFADGYSHLSFIPDNFGIKADEVKPEDVSVVFHEFTHQLALKGPFGWLCAYFQVIRPIAGLFAELQANIEFPEIFSSGEIKQDYQLLITMETFYEVYGNCLANYYDLIDGYRWVLEGIALFAQFDFKLSSEFDAASELFYFAAELVKTERFRGEETLTLSDIIRFIDEARNSKLESGLLQVFLENTRPDTSLYFMGYLMLKQIQRILAAKDNRLQDPEIFFIFIQGYFFRDRKVIELCQVKPRYSYQEIVSEFLQHRVSDLLNVETYKLSLVIDSICNFAQSQVHPDLLDFAHLLREGEYALWVDTSAVKQLDGEIAHFTQQLEQSEIFEAHRDNRHFQKQVNEALQSARFLFHTLRNLMLTFKMKHIERAILGYQINPDGFVVVTSIGVKGTPFSLLESIPADEFAPLIEDAEQEQFEIARNNKHRMPQLLAEAFRNAEWDEFYRLLWDYYQKGNLLIVQDYDIYLMMGRERCRLWVRGDFLRVQPYHWPSTAQSNRISAEEDLGMLQSIGAFFHHRQYLPLLQMPQIINGPGIAQDSEFSQDILSRMWKLVFPNCSASAKELYVFGAQKTKIIAIKKTERELLKNLSHSPDYSSDDASQVAESINRRWQYFTGRNLIKTTSNGTSHIVVIDL